MTLLERIEQLRDSWILRGGKSDKDGYEDALNDCIDELINVIRYYKNTNKDTKEINGFTGITISLQNEFGKYTIHSKQDCSGIYDLKDNLLVPLLLAMGYHPETIASLFE